jgi:hypothetical protein
MELKFWKYRINSLLQKMSKWFEEDSVDHFVKMSNTAHIHPIQNTYFCWCVDILREPQCCENWDWESFKKSGIFACTLQSKFWYFRTNSIKFFEQKLIEGCWIKYFVAAIFFMSNTCFFHNLRDKDVFN